MYAHSLSSNCHLLLFKYIQPSYYNKHSLSLPNKTKKKKNEKPNQPLRGLYAITSSPTRPNPNPSQAQHSEEREKWVRRLEDTIRRHANRSRLWDNQSTFYLGGYQKDVVGNKRANHLELLGRRVSEADAYLQLIIEQTNVSGENLRKKKMKYCENKFKLKQY